MEHNGFGGDDQERYYQGASAGWPQILDALERGLSRINVATRQPAPR